MEELLRAIRKSARQKEIFQSVMESRRRGDLATYFRGIREIYELEADEIERQEYNPYIVDWVSLFTPIENDVWFTVRALSLPMYPQFPVGRYFVDFGDAKWRLAFECDGKEWHDKESDERRDKELRRLGWDVLRIPGWRCRRGEFDPEGSHQFIRSYLGMPATNDPYLEDEEAY